LLCLCNHFQNNPTANSGWTQVYNQNAVSQDGTAAFRKLAGAGESATQTPFAGINEGTACIWEISGLTGVAGTDFQQNANGFDLATTPAFTTTSFNVSADNSMVFGLCGGTIATTPQIPTVTTGQTNDQGQTDSGGAHRNSGNQYFHKFFASNGSAVQFTATFGSNQIDGHYGIVVMNWTALSQSLAGSGSGKAKGRAGTIFTANLAGSSLAKTAGRLFYGALQPLIGRGCSALQGRTTLGYGVVLVAFGFAKAKGQALPAGTLTLLAQGSVKTHGRGFGTQALFATGHSMFKAVGNFSTFRGFAPTVRNIIGVIWPNDQ
jgi:hypothetical protein